jgi:hypothetical protein
VWSQCNRNGIITESATEIEDYEVEEQYNEADAIAAKTTTEPTFSTNRIAPEDYEK